MKRRSIFFIVMLLTILTACGKKEGSGAPAPTTEPTEVTTPTPTQAPEPTYTPENLFDYRVENNQVTIVGLKVNDATDIVIPEVIENCPVTAVGDRAFANVASLQGDLNIPDSVTQIGAYAFAGCTGLKSMQLPNRLTVIDECVFMGCTNLKSIGIPESVEVIGKQAFLGCKSIESVGLPKGLTGLGNEAFRGCTGLKNIVIPGGVDTIGEEAFWGCTGLEKVIISDGVGIIGKSAFSGCKALNGVTLPASVLCVREAAFYGCESLENATIMNSSIVLESKAFGNCPAMEKGNINDRALFDYIIADNQVTITGAKGREIQTLKIPETIEGYSVTAIGDSAFEGYEVKGLTLPSTLKTIGRRAFYGCDLEILWLPEGLKVIGDEAFSLCRTLNELYIPESVEVIGESAFKYCWGVEQYNIPERFREKTYITNDGSSCYDIFGRRISAERVYCYSDGNGAKKVETKVSYIPDEMKYTDGQEYGETIVEETKTIWDAEDNLLGKYVISYDYTMRSVTKCYYDANEALVRKIETKPYGSICYDGAGKKLIEYEYLQKLRKEPDSETSGRIVEYIDDTCVRKIIYDSEKCLVFDGEAAITASIPTFTTIAPNDNPDTQWSVRYDGFGFCGNDEYYPAILYKEHDAELPMSLVKVYDCHIYPNEFEEYESNERLNFFFDMYYQFD